MTLEQKTTESTRMQEVSEARGQIVSWWRWSPEAQRWTCVLRLNREGRALGQSLRRCQASDPGAFRVRVRRSGARSAREWLRYEESEANVDLSQLTRDEMAVILAHRFTQGPAWRRCSHTTRDECNRQGCFYSEYHNACTELEERCDEATDAGYGTAVWRGDGAAYRDELRALEQRCNAPGLLDDHQRRRRQAKQAAVAAGTAALGTVAYNRLTRPDLEDTAETSSSTGSRDSSGNSNSNSSSNGNGWSSVKQAATGIAQQVATTLHPLAGQFVRTLTR